MNKQTLKLDEGRTTTAISISTTSSATLIGFSVAVITLMLLQDDLLEKFPDAVYIFLFYILAITFFIFANELFILSSWDTKNYSFWITSGSVIYGLGKGWIILGISLTFKILINSEFLAYFTLTLFLVGYLIYYGIRGWLTQEKFFIVVRYIARGIIITQIIIGFIIIYLLN